jgi:hypothetical protein
VAIPVIQAFLTSSNILALQEGDERPSVTPHLEKLYDSRIAMEAAVSKMVRVLCK